MPKLESPPAPDHPKCSRRGDVPVDQMSSYTENIFDQPVVPEPARSTQEIYALLDPVVQAVLTDEDADIDALVAQVQKEAQALLDAAQG